MKKVFSFVDAQLGSLSECIEKDIRIDGDSILFDDAEYLHGIGFVAGQRYIATVRGTLKLSKKDKMDKMDPLLIGLKLNNGTTFASVVNAAANYWKHSDEWDFSKLDGRQEGTRKTIESIGVAISEYERYVTTNIMQGLRLNKFSDLAAILRDWSVAVVDWSDDNRGVHQDHGRVFRNNSSPEQ